MSALPVALMVVAAVAAVLYPLVAGARRSKLAPAEPAAAEGKTGYLSTEEIEFDFRSGKLEKATYERLLVEQAGGGTPSDDIEAEIRMRRANRVKPGAPAASGVSTAAPAPRAARAVGGLSCAKCGSPVERDDAYCARCGAALTPGAKNLCPSCGAAMEPDDDFCARCGHRLK
jgi:hypothetical protein